eukprot:6456964-Amphidinium_carterae.1
MAIPALGSRTQSRANQLGAIILVRMVLGLGDKVPTSKPSLVATPHKPACFLVICVWPLASSLPVDLNLVRVFQQSQCRKLHCYGCSRFQMTVPRSECFDFNSATNQFN